jgi:hypothetical protein
MPKARRGKRCNTRRKNKKQIKRRSPRSPGSSPVGAPRRNQSQRETRTDHEATSSFFARLRHDAADYTVIVAGLIRIWEALPGDVREQVARILHMLCTA